MNNQWFSKVAVWMVIALVLFTVFKQFDRGTTQGSQIAYSDFLDEVRAKRIRSVTLQEGPNGTEVLAITNDSSRRQSQCCSVLSPTSTGSAGATVCLPSR